MDKYEKIRILGSGTYGTAIKVRGKDGKDYVVKRISLGANSQKERDEAYHEVKVLSSLRHPHIVPYVECFFEEDDWEHTMCLVMACCDQGDLNLAIQEHKAGMGPKETGSPQSPTSPTSPTTKRLGMLARLTKPRSRKNSKIESAEAPALEAVPFPESEVWRCCVQLLLALQYLHKNKYLHRDIKVHNIFLAKVAGMNCYMLGDFGVSKCLDASSDLAKSQVGTLQYLSPEIVEGRPYGSEGDIWALGCVLHEMCTLQTLFGGTNPVQVLMKVMSGDVPCIGSQWSPELREVVGLMLTRNTADRPTSTQLLKHPAVMKRVEEYLVELERAGPKGWDSWKMYIPPCPASQSPVNPLNDLMAQVFACEEGDFESAFESISEVDSEDADNIEKTKWYRNSNFASIASEISDGGSCMSAGFDELRVLSYQLQSTAAPVVDEEESLARRADSSTSSPFMSVAIEEDIETQEYDDHTQDSDRKNGKSRVHVHDGVAARHRLAHCVKYTDKNRLEERATQLRDRCMKGLGVQKYNSLHSFLKSSSSLNGSLDDLTMRSELGKILDEYQFDFWPLMEELLLCEETLLNK